jgi:hypothetical protein
MISELELAELDVVAAHLQAAFDKLKDEPDDTPWDAYARRLFAVGHIAPSIRLLQDVTARLRDARATS